MSRSPYLLFFVSGISGLIYQVVWVREFGNLFGNTVYSAALVVAVFMSGLGVGSLVAGLWADRRHDRNPRSMLRAFGYSELAIGVLGLALSLGLPRLRHFPSLYTRDASGWYAVSLGSHLAQYAAAAVILAPITAIMGGTLTLLIRHLLARDLRPAGNRVGALYGLNTAGAAFGCFLTDYALIPHLGLRGTQGIAILLNLAVGTGAFFAARRELEERTEPSTRRKVRGRKADRDVAATPQRLLVLVTAAMFVSGFAAMAMEIVWFRHMSALVGPFRSVFSLLVTVILIAMGVGSLASGWASTRVRHPLRLLIVAESAFVIAALIGAYGADVTDLIAEQDAVAAAFMASSGWARQNINLWLILHPLLREVAVPALFMGAAYPLANAAVQAVPSAIGRRAGLVYLANTAGAVMGSLVAAFVLLPGLGMQRTITVVVAAAVVATVMLFVASSSTETSRKIARRDAGALAVSLAVVAVAIALWMALPPDYVVTRSLPRLGAGERRLAVAEGLTETVSVTETAAEERWLRTNGYSMSATFPGAQRYMRALAHLPLLSLGTPERVLVIGFGVGNTLHAASLYPSVHRLELADLSETVLRHAHYFASSNGDVMNDPRLAVVVNDGRHHLQLQAPDTYDLITLEPPPITIAEVASLYSKEFYELARNRLKPSGYITQWLPAYQVPEDTTLAMVRAFTDVFPRSVLLSGFRSELILMGTKNDSIEIDPVAVAARIRASPAVEQDLRKNFLGTLTELIGTFAGSGETLARAAASSPPEIDDRPVQEYAAQTRLREGKIPQALFDVTSVATWCPKCFVDGKPISMLEDLPAYLSLLGRVYADPAFLEPANPTHRLRIVGDASIRDLIERQPYIALLFNVRMRN